MLLLALALVVSAFALYLLVPALLIYSPYPWPVYGLLVAAIAVSVASKRRGVLRWLTIGFTTIAALLFLTFTLALSNLGRGELAVKPGDRFPEFTLQTSSGESFSPSQLSDRSAALYVFYRGDW